MDTKKFKVQGSEKTKGGKNNTQTILGAAGITILGGASAGAGYAAVANGMKEPEKDEVPTEKKPEEEVPEMNQVPTPEKEEEQPDTQNETVQNQVEQPTNATEYQPTGETTQTTDTPPSQQEQPSNSQNGQQEQPSNSQNGQQEQPSNSQNGQQASQGEQQGGQSSQQAENQPTPTQPENHPTSPDEVSQTIIEEIDKNDIDIDNVLTIDGFSTAFGPDGSEYIVANVHTPDGTNFLLADTDGDGIYTEVYDLAGNYIAPAEGNLTESDLEEMYNDTGDYLAMGDEPTGDDPTVAITNTDGSQPEDNELAQTTEEENVSVDDILAQLTDGEMAELDEVVVELAEGADIEEFDEDIISGDDDNPDTDEDENEEDPEEDEDGEDAYDEGFDNE